MTVACLALPGPGALILVPLRLPDQFLSFREVAALPNTPFRLHMSALSWCSVNHTDGLVTRKDLGLVAAQAHASERHAAECERSGAWHDARHDCGSGLCPGPQDADGWVVHDFYRYDVPEGDAENAEALERRRSADAARKRRERERKAVENPQPRRRGRPPGNSRTANPQVRNMSRDTENMSRDSHVTGFGQGANPQVKNVSRDGITDQSDRSDLDQSPGSQINQSSRRNARERETDDDVTRAAVEALRERDVEAGDALAWSAARKALARRKGRSLKSRAAWVRTVIANEADLYADLLCDPAPPKQDILREFGPAPGAHQFVLDPETRACAKCRKPEIDTAHRKAS